ncbi:MAG: hypothetical protein ABJA78_03405 [Ferruginibacter sp.]
MDQVYNDYILYYEARMKKREYDPFYNHSYLAEKAMYELVASCSSMEELQGQADQFKTLSVQNAVALVKDQERFRQKIYNDCKETIRAKAPAVILDQLDEMKSDADIVNMVNNVLQQNNIEVTVDQLMHIFYSDFIALENIEVYQQAVVPEEWKTKIAQYEKDIFESGKKIWLEKELPEAGQWQQGWILDYALLKEERHRRLIPVNDEELEKKISLHQKYKPA